MPYFKLHNVVGKHCKTASAFLRECQGYYRINRLRYRRFLCKYIYTKKFLKLVSIVFVMAIPLVFYGLQRWLQGFAYNLQVSWLIFILAQIFLFFIVIITVSSQGKKTAIAKPVKSYRKEWIKLYMINVEWVSEWTFSLKRITCLKIILKRHSEV